MATILTKEDVEALLGRSLTSAEVTNFDLYLEIAKIRLEDLLCSTIDVEQGETLSADLALVLARMFDVITTENLNQGTVQTKRVEDFSVTYDTNISTVQAFVANNAITISKYSKCQGKIQSGDVNYGCIRFI